MKKLFVLVMLVLFATSVMAIQTIQIGAAGTASYNTAKFVNEQGRETTVIYTGTVAAGEDATIQVSYDGGTTWVNTADTLTSTDLARVIVAPGDYRINKPTTAGNAGIAIAR